MTTRGQRLGRRADNEDLRLRDRPDTRAPGVPTPDVYDTDAGEWAPTSDEMTAAALADETTLDTLVRPLSGRGAVVADTTPWGRSAPLRTVGSAVEHLRVGLTAGCPLFAIFVIYYIR